MNKLMTTTSVISCLLFSSLTMADRGRDHYDYARVTSVKPVYTTVTTRVPSEQCWVETVAYERDLEGPRSHTGTIVGGLVGAAVGNRLGHHKSNKQVGAVAGAILGASIGRDISNKHRSNGSVTEYRDVERCETTYREQREQRIIGYDVNYRYHGQLYQTRTDQHPGERIKVAVSVRPAI